MSNGGRFVKGQKKPNQGKRGPNKTTVLAREAIARFVDGNAHRLEGWLDEIAQEKGAEAAFRCFMDVVEYHVPKLARTEHVGDGGGPVRIMATSQDEAL
jgi:hypothetical protein